MLVNQTGGDMGLYAAYYSVAGELSEKTLRMTHQTLSPCIKNYTVPNECDQKSCFARV